MHTFIHFINTISDRAQSLIIEGKLSSPNYVSLNELQTDLHNNNNNNIHHVQNIITHKATLLTTPIKTHHITSHQLSINKHLPLFRFKHIAYKLSPSPQTSIVTHHHSIAINITNKLINNKKTILNCTHTHTTPISHQIYAFLQYYLR